MRSILDTNVAIHLRDGEKAVARRIAELPVHPMLSAVTRVELEGGVYRDPDQASALRARLDLILGQFEILPFTTTEAVAYGQIIEQCGYSRRRVIDRMIAATAIVAEASLITLNPADFADIPGLTLEDWTVPPE